MYCSCIPFSGKPYRMKSKRHRRDEPTRDKLDSLYQNLKSTIANAPYSAYVTKAVWKNWFDLPFDIVKVSQKHVAFFFESIVYSQLLTLYRNEMARRDGG